MNKILFDLKVQQKPLNGCEFHLPFARFPHIRMHYTIFKKSKDLQEWEMHVFVELFSFLQIHDL